MRDVVGRLVDTTEGYLPAFDIAAAVARLRRAGPAGHGQVVTRGGSVPPLTRTNAARLRADIDRMLAEFDRLTPDEGAGSWCRTRSWARCRRCSTRRAAHRLPVHG